MFRKRTATIDVRTINLSQAFFYFRFDCSADETIGSMHIEWLKKGVHVVTANNTALSGSVEMRQKIKEIEKQKKAKYLREVTVGGGLPVRSFYLFLNQMLYYTRIHTWSCNCT